MGTTGYYPETGYTGRLSGRRVMVVFTSGVWAPNCGPEFGTDFHSTYFLDWLRFGGITDLEVARFQPSLISADVDANRRAADQQARAGSHPHVQLSHPL